jgi:O-antigen/teichoic acid export membrane protein
LSSNSYRSILKATSIFGGVQLINILITLVRGKLVAVLIGPAGMGLNGLLLSGTSLITSICSLGINESAVKDLSVSHEQGKVPFAKSYAIYRTWVWWTAGLSALITVLFSPLISKLIFGDFTQTFSFMLLSSTMIFGAMSGGIYTVLRSTRRISHLAKANIYGSISGLLVSLPLYYFFGTNGVVPAIVLSAFTAFLISLLFRKHIQIEKVELTLKEKYDLGKPMVKMGINMSLGVLMGTVTTFVLSLIITRYGGIKELGLYNAANSIMVGYVGMVFSAMSADYFPRLSQAVNLNQDWRQIINHQAEILILILTLVISILMGSVSFLIELLLSKDFESIDNFILILALSLPIKGLVWCLGFLYLAQNESKMFLKVEFFGALSFLAFNYVAYSNWGIIGLAISNIVVYSLAFIAHIIIIKKRYNFQFRATAYILVIFCLLFLLLIFSTFFIQFKWVLIFRWMVIIFTIIFVAYQFNIRMSFIQRIKEISLSLRLWK